MQCASHLNLGHGIQVVNEGDPNPPKLKPVINPPPPTANAAILAGQIVLIALAMVPSMVL